jgi:hypothetical protein
MNILFVQTNTNTYLRPFPVGPALVAARLRGDGHELRFVDLMGEKHPARIAADAARESRPELVCFSIRNRDNQMMQRYDDPLPGVRDTIAAVREATEAPFLLGGTAFSTYPARILGYMSAGRRTSRRPAWPSAMRRDASPAIRSPSPGIPASIPRTTISSSGAATSAAIGMRP